MSGPGLYHELWSAVARVRQRHLNRLRAMGIDFGAVARLGARQHPFGVACVERLREGFYQPGEGGVDAVIMPVLVPDDDTVMDLVAWVPRDPNRWWWRTGYGVALGLDLLERGDSVRVVATPLDWLSAAGEAICILDWSERSPIWSALRHGPSLTFADDRLRRRVRNGLILAAPMPQMELSPHVA